MKAAVRITLMLGGPSAEREVSLRSGAAVSKALSSLGHLVTELDPQGDDWVLPEGTEVVFIALHGTYGEDGGVQHRLETLGVPYTGSDAEASRIAFDKLEAKRRCARAGVAMPRFCLVGSASSGWPPGWYPPVVVKPVRQGSSVGLHFVSRIDEWHPALEDTLHYDQAALVEERVPGREMTVGILGARVLPVVEIVPPEGEFDYVNKYTAGRTEFHCPARLEKPATDRVQAVASEAFKAVGGRDFGRVDLIIRPEGTPVLLEVNTLPGMTETSLLPKAAAVAGIEFEQLCQQMIELALGRADLGGDL